MASLLQGMEEYTLLADEGEEGETGAGTDPGSSYYASTDAEDSQEEGEGEGEEQPAQRQGREEGGQPGRFQTLEEDDDDFDFL